MPRRPLFIGVACVWLAAALLASSGRDALALSALTGLGPFAMSWWLRFRDPQLSGWHTLVATTPIVWTSLLVVMAGYWLFDAERRVSRSQIVGLSAAGVAGMGVSCLGGVAGRAVARRRRSEPRGIDTTLLAGRYRLERSIGHGGMATVSVAHDTVLDRRVAVKIVRDELVGIPGAAERFQREARAAAAFSHPNVVTVFDYGVSGSQAFLVMELLQGRTVRELLRADAPVATARALGVLRDVAAALDAAHRQRLIHRDLKPENIYLVADGADEHAKVLDFGLARLMAGVAFDAATDPALEAQLVGTPPYMAPEQLRGEAPDPSWDLWALSVIAFEMLCGAHPYAVVSLRLSGLGAHGDPTAQLPSRAQACFARALALDRAARPTSAPQFVAELQRSLDV